MDGEDQMRTALVTGASGLLGYWLVQALLERGVRVVTLQRDPSAPTALRIDGLDARCTVVRGDLLDAPLLARVLGEHGIDSVFHLAAQAIASAGAASSVTTFETNVRGTWLLLDACRAAQVARAVVASTERVYGPPTTPPPTEDAPLRAALPYDASKAAADVLARSFFHGHGLPVAVVRLANVYGAGDLNGSRLVPGLTAAALAGRAPVIRSDGSPARDLLHGEDAAAALLAVAGALPGAAAGEAFNAGSGISPPVRTVAEQVVRLCGSAVAPEFRAGAAAAGEDGRRLVDASRLRALTGWAPRVSLEDGLARTVAWYRAHPQALGG